MQSRHLFFIPIVLAAVAVNYSLSDESDPTVEPLSSSDSLYNSTWLSNVGQAPITISVFHIEETSKVETIDFATEYRLTQDLDLDEQEVVQVGQPGEITSYYSLHYWGGEMVGKTLDHQDRVEPVSEIINSGTRRNYRTMNTASGPVEYYKTLRMWAMSYDGNCLGCSGRTATGKKVTHGICAVDPTVIPLGSKVYVPGYGFCHAEDTGGAIQGNVIDLGFEDVGEGWWSSRSIEVYFVD